MGIAFRHLFGRWLGGRGYLETSGFIMPATPLYWNIKQSLPSRDIIQYHRYALQYSASSWFTGVLVAGILSRRTHITCCTAGNSLTISSGWLAFVSRLRALSYPLLISLTGI